MMVAGVPVLDPFEVASDPAMPCLEQALDPATAQAGLRATLSKHGWDADRLVLRAIRVTRHKPGRRCLIEYDLHDRIPGSTGDKLTIIGKVRARGVDRNGYQTQAALWAGGFRDDSGDGLAVPEPLGIVPAFEMWLQRKAPGRPLTRLLLHNPDRWLADCLAMAAHRLHRAGISARRAHTIDDELRILAGRLEQVAAGHPCWAGRLARVLNGCERLAGRIPPAVAGSIHRDFHPDQVIVDGRRLYLLDFDLYSAGDPALDIGNFLGHITELRLRARSNDAALLAWDRRMAARYLSLSPGTDSETLESYRTLTLARHIWISRRFPDRRACTESLLELCEQRLVCQRLL